jgi:hypothetical protein
MKFESVSIDEVRQKIEAPRKEVHTEQVELEVKTFHVVDPESGEVVGYIDAPITYCDTLQCPQKVGKKHPMGFINPLDSRTDPRTLWVHQHCMLPTRQWWRSQWRSMVYGGKPMLWDTDAGD